MPSLNKEIKITPSILDRLIDFEPKLLQESPKSRLKSLREFKQLVRRDLEWLLNTRCHLFVSDSSQELYKSVLMYGLPDFTGVGIRSKNEQMRLTKAIENAIKTYEPRLSNLRVTLEPFSDVDKTIKFRIEAELKIEPVPEPVVFDTILQLGRGSFDVKEA
ncbi:MAG: type VI secretion system baseplate subunit TssE [Acidobacteria bacterium]|jgi:type VI secretion system protein ImpF|nr:MAG: type VI secretion system baseplate subunit TssE [Acidobacteriota bacterium]GIU83137.1 MAG: type VI secretion protein [Pyrinomonadaceae bacterium]